MRSHSPSFRRKPESSAALREPSLRRSGPQPSFRRKPESMPAGPIADSLNRHSGASRNLCLPPPLPHPPTVIPAQAGIHACRPHHRLPQPSFRRKPESMPAASIADSLNRHSGASRNPCLPAPLPTPSTVIPAQAGIHACRPHCRLPQPSFRRKPESTPGRIRSKPRPGGPPTVIPAKAGIQGVRPHSPPFRLPQPSFRRKPESMPASPITISPNRHPVSLNRHSGFRRNLCLPAPLPSPPTVIPAQAGIQGVKNHYRQPRQNFQLASPTSRNPHTT